MGGGGGSWRVGGKLIYTCASNTLAEREHKLKGCIFATLGILLTTI